MAKKVVKSRPKNELAVKSEFKLVVPEGQTEQEYRKTLDACKELIKATDAATQEFNKKRLPIMWDIGKKWIDFFSKAKDAHGRISDQQIDAVLADIARDTGYKFSGKEFRLFLRTAELWDRDRIVQFGKEGLATHHLAAFAQIADKKFREQFEERVISEKISGNRAHEELKQIAKTDDGKYLQGGTKARLKQASTVRGKKFDSPVKHVHYVLKKLDVDKAALTALFISVKDVKKLGNEGKTELIEPLDELIVGIRELGDIARSIADEAVQQLAECKNAKIAVKAGAKEKDKK